MSSFSAYVCGCHEGSFYGCNNFIVKVNDIICGDKMSKSMFIIFQFFNFSIPNKSVSVFWKEKILNVTFTF